MAHVPVQKVCPLTMGKPTSMTESGITTMCARYRREASENEGTSRTALVVNRYRCPECKELPDELTMLSLPGDITEKGDPVMASKKREGKCENCGEIKTISVNYGKEVCSMCANLRVNIKKRPGVVLRSLAELAPEAVSELTDVQTLEATIADQRKELEQLREKLSTAQIIQEPAAVTTGSSFAKLELAYRLAVGMIKGEVEGVAVEDLELIRW